MFFHALQETQGELGPGHLGSLLGLIFRWSEIWSIFKITRIGKKSLGWKLGRENGCQWRPGWSARSLQGVCKDIISGAGPLREETISKIDLTD